MQLKLQEEERRMMQDDIVSSNLLNDEDDEYSLQARSHEGENVAAQVVTVYARINQHYHYC